MEKLDIIIATNLTYLRKKAKLTQLEFGEKFNYSDKTVSKWELGTVIPSVDVLKSIADFYGVSVDYILTEHHNKKEYDSEIMRTINVRDRIIFIALVVAVVWCIAAVVYAVGYLGGLPGKHFWTAFMWAVPASFLVTSYFTRKSFRNSIFSLIFFSIFVWTTLISIFFHTLVNGNNYWFLFIVGIPVQALLLLLMLKKKN